MSTITARAPWLIAGLILGLLIGGAWNLGYFTLQPTLTVAATSTSALPPESGDVAVATQPAGMSAVIESVTVPPPGVWVAVQEVNEDGSLGNVLGAARVAHPTSNVSVSLLRHTLPGQEYAAVLYRDDGDGAFNVGRDSAYIDFNTGARVVELFKTTP